MVTASMLMVVTTTLSARMWSRRTPPKDRESPARKFGALGPGRIWFRNRREMEQLMPPISEDPPGFEQDMSKFIGTAHDDPAMRLGLEVFRDVLAAISTARERGRIAGLDQGALNGRLMTGAMRAIAQDFLGETSDAVKREARDETDRFVRRLHWIRTRRRAEP
jgi:hypothetical protein